MYWPPGPVEPFMIRPQAQVTPPKVSEPSRIYSKVISDVPYFVEQSASCTIAEKEQPFTDDADVEEAEIKSSEEARLRAEAISLEHLTCHLPKNPYCQSCSRAKLFRHHHSRRRARGSFRDDSEKFEDKVIADSLVANGRNLSFEGFSSAVISYDIATTLTEPFPMPSQRFLHVRKAILTESLGY